MAGLRYLLVWVALVDAVLANPAHRRSKAGLCPDETEISPCVCTSDNVFLNMDCSDVISSSRLAEVFQVDFPFSEFNNFTIAPDTPTSTLQDLPSGVFGEVSFEQIFIRNTYIETIEEEALTPSMETLLRLEVTGNRISVFPFETIPLYIHLQALILDDNLFPFLPDIVSDSLKYLSLSQNIGLTFTVDTFSQAGDLIDIQLANMELTYMEQDVFAQLNYIESIDLSGNKFEGELETGFMSVPLDTLRHLYLNDNTITGIKPQAITGVDRAAIIDFRGNNIERLDEENWSNLVDQVTRNDAIDLRENPLLCGCDVLWLAQDDAKMVKIHQESSCVGGMLLHDVPLDALQDLC